MNLAVCLLILYLAANGLVAVMLGCMVQSRFVASTNGFRFMIAVLAAFSLVLFLGGLKMVIAGDVVTLGEFAAIAIAQVLQSIALATVLVLMRLRQVAAGEHLHPRQRADLAGRAV